MKGAGFYKVKIHRTRIVNGMEAYRLLCAWW
jgi:hypothetical protein